MIPVSLMTLSASAFSCQLSLFIFTCLASFLTACVTYRPEEAEKALEASREKHFFGSQIRVEPHVGYICDAPEEESEEPEYDEYHVKSTRTLFCGNLEPHTSSSTLRETFRKFGDIVVSCMYCDLYRCK